MCEWVASHNAYGDVQSCAGVSRDTISVYLHSSVCLHSLRLTQLSSEQQEREEVIAWSKLI